MAEKIISPGVFTTENDLSFLPTGISEIGAAIIGPTTKGPAFVPTVVESYDEFVQKFGPSSEKTYIPYTVREYLKSAGRVTIVRLLGTAGYSLTKPIALGIEGGNVISLLHPTKTITSTGTTELFEGAALTSNESGSFVLLVSGSAQTDSDFTNKVGTYYSASYVTSNSNNINKVFGDSPEGVEPVYNYVNFKNYGTGQLAISGAYSASVDTGSSTWDFSDEFSSASTPWITSQKVNGNNVNNLLKIHTLSHGDTTNYETKIGISEIKAGGTLAGTDYGSFTLVVRAVDQDKIPNSPYTYDDTDQKPNVLETYSNLNLNPDSPNYISRRIGDRYLTTDTNGKVSVNGDYPNLSAYIRVEVDSSVGDKAYNASLVPFGYAKVIQPIPTTFGTCPSSSVVTDQTINSIYNKKKYWGFDYDFSNTDNVNYLKPLPAANSGTGSNAAFYLGDHNQNTGANYPTAASPYTGAIDLSTNTSTDSRKFMIPLQGGFDGLKPNTRKLVGTDIKTTNTQGYDCSTTSAAGYTAYKRAIDAVSNPDEYDINMLVTPGVLHRLHSAVTTVGKDMCEDRGDAFYVMDNNAIADNIATAVTSVETFDSNYAGTYYPWVKILDADRNKPVWVPPSVVLPSVIAYTDRVAHEWFAPAGLNRGGLTAVSQVYTRLTHDERDTLYEGRVNPIATFPNQGVVVWGQKTLQGKASALDRINVRRLLIAVKKFIASSSRYLVFEQNSAATRNRFLNIVNPYLESIQQRQGLYSFKVVMDETNNTPDVIDRNILKGDLYLQPTKTAEFIVLDFNILPTGASFPE